MKATRQIWWNGGIGVRKKGVRGRKPKEPLNKSTIRKAVVRKTHCNEKNLLIHMEIAPFLRVSAFILLVFCVLFFKRAHLSHCSLLSQFCAVNFSLLYHQQIGAGKQNVQLVNILCYSLIPHFAEMKFVFQNLKRMLYHATHC